MSHSSVLSINNFEQLLNEDNFSNLLSSLSGKDNLEESLQKLSDQKSKIEVKKTVAVSIPVEKIAKIEKARSRVLRKEVGVLLATALYATSCVEVKEPEFVNQIDFKNSTHEVTSSSTPKESTIITTKIKKEPISTKLARFFLTGNIHEPEKETINLEASKPDIKNDDEDEIKQPIVVFDNRPADELMAEAKKLLLEKSGDYSQAIANLKSIISTQPADSAKEAHEMLGYAYEKEKNFNKAMKEYQRYLAIYTEDNEDRTRVRQRLMGLEILEPTGFLIGKIDKTKAPHQGDSFEFNGNTSNYVYVTKNNNVGVDQKSQQINLISGAQISLKEVHNEYELSARARFSQVKDFNEPAGNRTNLSSAYVDFANTFKGYNIRAGRQNSVAGSVGRFDGVSGGIKVSDDLKISAAVGNPVLGSGSKSKRIFEGVEFDWRINNNLGTGLYINRGVADGLLERMAIGSSLDYRTNQSSLLLRSEYDTVYHSLNLISLQGNYYTKKFDAFAIFERRRTPMPYGDVALTLGEYSLDRQYYNSIGDLLSKSGLTPDEIYNYISQSTPIATSAVVGIRKKVSKNWEITLDAQSTNLSTVPGFNLNSSFEPIPIQVGDKQNYSLTAHLKGENILLTNNSVEFAANDSTGGRKSSYITFADNFKFGDKNRNSVSTVLRLDTVNENYGKIDTLSAMLRGFYSISDHTVLEGQYSQSLTKTRTSLYTNPTDKNQNFYIGFRHDF
jgi:tetratricopeptide (TPR) repeat protein